MQPDPKSVFSNLLSLVILDEQHILADIYFLYLYVRRWTKHNTVDPNFTMPIL